MTEMHLNARYIANAVQVPVIADADNGYGNAINVMRTVREYIGTGVAGIHIEDQAIPKRCGHVAGRRVIPIEEAVGKYRAADAVRRELDPDFVLIARTDARGAAGGSLDDAIGRANAYLEAGADLAFVEGPTSVDEVRRICREVKGPVFYNQTGVSPRFGLAEMHNGNMEESIWTPYISGSVKFNPKDNDWPCNPKWFPDDRWAQNEPMTILSRLRAKHEQRHWYIEVCLIEPLHRLYIAHFARACPSHILLGKSNSRGIGCGFDSGDLFTIGTVTSKGFKPLKTP